MKHFTLRDSLLKRCYCVFLSLLVFLKEEAAMLGPRRVDPLHKAADLRPTIVQSKATNQAK